MSKVLIVQAVFYDKISALLLKGATEELTRQGYKYDVVNVPGAFEISAAISFAKDTTNAFFKNYDKYDGYIALGCVIRCTIKV